LAVDVLRLRFRVVREITFEIDGDLASMYSYASILNHWHLTTRFC